MKSKFKRRSATFKPSNTPPNQVVKSSVTETPKAKEEVNMVKRNTRSSTSPAISTRRRHGVTMDLMMDCQDDDLSPSQIDYMRKCRLEYDNAMTLIKDAQNKARLGKATVSIQKNVNKSGSVLPISPGNAVTPKQQETPNRPSSPDVIIVGETPPKQKPSTPVTAAKTRSPVGKSPQQIVVRPLQNAGNIQQQQRVQQPTFLKVIPVTSPSAQFPFAPAQHNLVANRQTLRPLYQQQQFVAAQNSASNMLMNSAMQAKRNLENVQDADGPLRKKQKKVETNEVGNWVPLDEYYYGKMEGDPSYVEEKGEFRFKCWYCSKMLYNNVKAMMHIQGHIDSGKQHNLDLSDLTQCKHCYKQFDTPFEMQTHVEKVHMNGANVLLCRICERDHESRNALTHHMRQNHTACEMPYICQLCSFRSSMYSDVVDHFKKKHDSSQHILCLYCLKIFKVKFVSQGWGQTQTYYGHLLKHQSKTATRKCTLCRLTFFNTGDVKSHKKKDHMANHKGILGTNNRYTTPGQVMIKVPESGLHAKQQSVKSLNAPAVSKVLDFGGTRFPTVVNYLTCLECKMSMGTPDHFKKHIECSMCRFATSCSIAYANHMMGFHSGQMSSLNLNIPWERRMELPMHCLCGFSSRYGNRIANHLVYCTKRTCYRSKQHSPGEDGASDEEMGDPRRKPGASLLDVLGLVKKRSVATNQDISAEIRRGSREDDRSIPPFRVNPSKTRSETTEEKSPPGGSSTASPKETSVSPPDKVSDAVDIPPELKGSRKWTTVKIQDQEAPSKASVFLGVKDESKEDVDDEGEVTPSAQNDDAEEGSDCGMKYKHEGKNTEDKQNIGECKPSVDLEFSVQSSKVVKSCIDKTELQKDDGKEKSLKVLADFDDEDDNDDVKSLEEDEINQLLKDVNDDKEDINQSDSKSEPGKDGDTADKTDLRVEDKNTDDLAVSQDGEADSTISDRKASVEQDDIESQMLESKGDNSACQEDNEESVDKENKSQEGETTADGKAADSGEEEKDNGGGGNEGGQLDTETMKSLVAEGKADNDGRNEVGVPDRETIKSMTAEEKPDDGSSNGGGEPDAETIESMAAEEKAHDGRNEEGEPVSETIESLAAEEKTDDGGSNGGGEPDTETIESMAAEEKAHDGRNEEGEPVSETIESLAAEEKAGNVDRNEGGEPDTEAIESMAAEEEADDGGSSCQEGESDTKINSLLNDSEAVTESSEKDQIISDLDEKESVKDSVHMEVSEKGTTENEKELLSDIENSESVAVETNEENTNYQKVEDCDGKQPSVSMEGDVTEKNTMEISAAKFCQDSKQSNDGMEIAKSNVELSDKEKSDEGASSSKHKSEITSDDCGDKGENTIHEQTKDSGQVKQGTPVEYNKEESPLRSERSGDKGERSSSEYKFSRDDKYQGSRTEHTKWSRSDHHHDHHGDRSHSSSYHDKRSQDSRHSSHHGDGRSYDRSHDYKRSQGQDYNRDRFHSSSYNDRRDNRGYQDNRNYHGNHPYGNRGQGDRRRDGHYDNYNRNQGHYNRGGRGGYGYGGGYQGNYR